MPRRTNLTIDELPYQYKGKKLQLHKSYTNPRFESNTVLTDDIYTYIDFYFASHKESMKYKNPAVSKPKYGNEMQYHYSFYWKQSMNFYYAAKKLPIEATPLLSYYSMLNAVKAYLAFKCDYIEDFVEHFLGHGLFEKIDASANDLNTIMVARKIKGVYPLFAKMMDSNFDTIWPNGQSNAFTLKQLLYNLAFIHRAFITTYTTPRGAKIPELFIPLENNSVPCYHKGNDFNLYLQIELEKIFFGISANSIPVQYSTSMSPLLTIKNGAPFILVSANGARRNTTDSLSTDFRNLNSELRKEFQYIRSSKRLWYLKRTNLQGQDIINLNSMSLIMAAMHRISEIARYKPEQLAHLMKSKENWLMHEFLTLALDQFIDELAAEITGQDIMCTGMK